MPEAAALFLAVQALRYALFDLPWFNRLWLRFKRVPVLYHALRSPFAQGLVLGYTAFAIYFNPLQGVIWGAASAFASMVYGRWADKQTKSPVPSVDQDSSEYCGEDAVVLLECNIDDMSGEFFSDIMKRLFELGALDVWFTSVYGKKNRPLYQLSALVTPDVESGAVRIILEHSSTGGIRRRTTQRVVMAKSFVRVELYGCVVNVKRLSWNDVVKYTPEWEDCAALARRFDRPVAEIYSEAAALAYQHKEERG